MGGTPMLLTPERACYERAVRSIAMTSERPEEFRFPLDADLPIDDRVQARDAATG
jgi:hypothetical protein